jgi:uncharacterized membrane protein YbaN (DUF454 family)
MVVREDIAVAESAQQTGARWFYVALGWGTVVLGTAGFFLPLLPSTVFFLIALWAFSRGSPRFEAWLVNHRLFGPTLQAWRRHRVIPAKAKAMALGLMALSLAIIVLWVAENWILPLAVGLVLAAVATFILRCPSRIPAPPQG